MSHIELALRAGIPLICVSTTDLLNLQDNLKEFKPQDRKLFQYTEGQKIQREAVYYHVGCIDNDLTRIYEEFVAMRSTLVIVNPSQPDFIYFDVGVLPTSPALLYERLSEFMSETKYKEILPAIGGLTLKDIIELLMITESKYGGITAEWVMQMRLENMQRSDGLDIVKTDTRGHVPEKRLHDFGEYNKDFFLKDYDYRLRPRGLIVHGDPGTGKTQGSKYLAKMWGVPLFRLDATVQSKWLGESERNLKQALKQLEQHAPCILLIDEAEKLFSKSNDQGASDKLLATLLWWLQEHDKKVFTYMTCNDIQTLPRELYRPGRVDEIIRVPLLSRKDATALQDIIADSFKEGDNIQFKPRKADLTTGASVFEDVKNTIKEKIKNG